MTTDLYWLTLSILLTSILWVPYIINRLIEGGFFFGLWDPDGNTASNVPWAQRLMSAHINAVENLVEFAPLVIIEHILEMNTDLTATDAILYFLSRVFNVIFFTYRVPVLRIVVFLGIFIAELMIIFTLIGWV